VLSRRWQEFFVHNTAEPIVKVAINGKALKLNT
jgi:hypothetical protein